MKSAIVIGSGFAGLSAAACLAQAGFDVTVLEKNSTPGGRARQFEAQGFTFDMGPSWYWMPDVFERFFKRFGRQSADFYSLKRLDPSYRVYFGKADYIDVPAGIQALTEMFEGIEPGSGAALRKFLEQGAHKYAAGMNRLVYKPGLSLREFADIELLKNVLKLNVFQSLSKYVRRFFKHPRLISLLEFPVLFLGAAPDKIPALYSLMNYADMALGTWYPMGGMYTIVDAMVKVAEEQGVKILYDHPVSAIEVANQTASGVWSNGVFLPASFIVASADYRHVEKDLLTNDVRQYTDRYWDTRTLAPSCLLFFVGLNKRVANLRHHTLFFDEDFTRHLSEIYTTPRWPTAPQFYVCCPSRTDDLVAPEGHENLFILIPVAPGLEDRESEREKYFDIVIRRMEALTGEHIRSNIVFKRSYAHNDFQSDYNAFKGNAYGLANTLMQTANFKPGMMSNKVNNLFYAGQLTVPGPGVPPSIISGQVAAAQVTKTFQLKHKQSPGRVVR